MANDKKISQASPAGQQTDGVTELASVMFSRLWSTNVPITTEALALKTLQAASMFFDEAAKFDKQSSHQG